MDSNDRPTIVVLSLSPPPALRRAVPCVQPFFEKTRVLFGWHAGGYIVPVRVNLQLVDDTFTGLMQPLSYDEDYIMVLADARMIVAASQTSLLLLGVSVDRSWLFPNLCRSRLGRGGWWWSSWWWSVWGVGGGVSDVCCCLR